LNLRFELRLGGYIPYGMRFFESHFPYGFFFKTTRVLLKTFERRTRGRLGTTREDFKTTQGSPGVPSSLGMLQVLLRTFGWWYSGTPEDYSSRPSRLLETILLDNKVFGGLSYGPRGPNLSKLCATCLFLRVTDLGEATFIYLGYSPW
jgi:hypothetical protein